MNDVATIEIDRDIIDVAARRAAEEGLSTSDFITLILRRSFERVLGEDSIIVYDRSEGEEGFTVAREPDESNEEYNCRAEHLSSIFGR